MFVSEGTQRFAEEPARHGSDIMFKSLPRASARRHVGCALQVAERESMVWRA